MLELRVVLVSLSIAVKISPDDVRLIFKEMFGGKESSAGNAAQIFPELYRPDEDFPNLLALNDIHQSPSCDHIVEPPLNMIWRALATLSENFGG